MWGESSVFLAVKLCVFTRYFLWKPEAICWTQKGTHRCLSMLGPCDAKGKTHIVSCVYPREFSGVAEETANMLVCGASCAGRIADSRDTGTEPAGERPHAEPACLEGVGRCSKKAVKIEIIRKKHPASFIIGSVLYALGKRPFRGRLRVATLVGKSSWV